MRGTKLQMTKFQPSKTWCTGGGWWTRPVMGSKSLMLKTYGYRQPSQPTTSSGWKGSVHGPDDPAGAVSAVLDEHVGLVVDPGAHVLGQQRSLRRSQVALAVGACSRNWPYLDR